MAQSLKERVEKEQARRDRVRSILASSDLGEAETPAEATDAQLAAAEVEVMGEEPDPEIDGEIADGDAVVPDEPVPVAEIAIPSDEVEKLADIQGKALEVHKVGLSSFVKLKDLLPPKPVRGDFDVRKIESSSYFFS